MLVHTLPFFFLHLQDAFGEKRKRKETARRGDLFQLSRHFHFSSELLKKTRRRENREHVEKKRVRNAASITAVDSLYTCKKNERLRERRASLGLNCIQSIAAALKLDWGGSIMFTSLFIIPRFFCPFFPFFFFYFCLVVFFFSSFGQQRLM